MMPALPKSPFDFPPPDPWANPTPTIEPTQEELGTITFGSDWDDEVVLEPMPEIHRSAEERAYEAEMDRQEREEAKAAWQSVRVPRGMVVYGYLVGGETDLTRTVWMELGLTRPQINQAILDLKHSKMITDAGKTGHYEALYHESNSADTSLEPFAEHDVRLSAKK